MSKCEKCGHEADVVPKMGCQELAIMREALLAIRDNPGVHEGAADKNLWPETIAAQALEDCSDDAPEEHRP